MHPILSERRIFLLYLTVWTLAGAFLAVLLSTSGMYPAAAAVTGIPMMLVYSFMCLASYYLCRTFPLSRTSVVRLLVIHVLSGGLTSLLWISLGRSWAALIDEIPALQSASTGYSAQAPLLFSAGVTMFLLSVAVHYSIIAFRDSRDAERQALDLRFLAQEAELRALRSQINPHFLFNSLNSISALTASDPSQARVMTLRLAEFFRKSLTVGARRLIPLREELDLVRSYVALEQVRFGPRLQFDCTAEEPALDCPVPPLILQPLIENAVGHGIAHSLEGGAVTVRVERRGEVVTVTMENPVDPDHRPVQGHGIGLQNVRSRVTTLYGPDASLETSSLGDRFRAVLTLPAVEPDQRPSMQFS